MPKGKRVKRPKPQQSRGQQNPIGIVNKQRSTGAPGSGTTSHQKNPGSATLRQGVSGGVGVTEAAEAAPKPTKTKAAEPYREKGPSKAAEAGPSKKVKKGVPKVKPAEAETGWSRSKAAEAYRRQRKGQEKPSSGMLVGGSEAGTYTKKPKAKGRYRGKGVVGRK
jgi:hypothetical protein